MKEKNQPSEKAKTEKISFTIPPIKGRNFDLETKGSPQYNLSPLVSSAVPSMR